MDAILSKIEVPEEVKARFKMEKVSDPNQFWWGVTAAAAGFFLVVCLIWWIVEK